jgi:hypothetical protein
MDSLAVTMVAPDGTMFNPGVMCTSVAGSLICPWRDGMSDTSIIPDPLNSVPCAGDAKGWPFHDKAVTVFAQPEQNL